MHNADTTNQPNFNTKSNEKIVFAAVITFV